MKTKKELRNEFLDTMMKSIKQQRELTLLNEKENQKQQARFIITGLDIITYIICMITFIIPFYEFSISSYLWLLGIALLGTILVRSLAHRIATLILVLSFSLLTIFFNFYLDFTKIFEFTFLINSASLSWSLVGTLLGGAIVAHGVVAGAKAKPENYRAGWSILTVVIVLTILDIIFARLFLQIEDWNQLILIGLTQIGIYTTALTITWVLTYAIVRLFVIAGSAIVNMQQAEVY
ncbi:MAG: hypothetical protein ACTSVY_07425 [Candidatus Helarchaeota archaeon]